MPCQSFQRTFPLLALVPDGHNSPPKHAKWISSHHHHSPTHTRAPRTSECWASKWLLNTAHQHQRTTMDGGNGDSDESGRGERPRAMRSALCFVNLSLLHPSLPPYLPPSFPLPPSLPLSLSLTFSHSLSRRRLQSDGARRLAQSCPVPSPLGNIVRASFKTPDGDGEALVREF